MIDRPTIPGAPIVPGNSKHDKIMNMLSKVAIAVEPVAQARIAAALVYKNDIIAVGINKKKTHPFQKKFGKNDNAIYLHAEIDAIKNAMYNVNTKLLEGAILYVCRVKFSDHTKKSVLLGMAKPCCGCSRAIATFGIKKVYYTLDNEGYDVL